MPFISTADFSLSENFPAQPEISGNYCAANPLNKLFPLFEKSFRQSENFSRTFLPAQNILKFQPNYLEFSLNYLNSSVSHETFLLIHKLLITSNFPQTLNILWKIHSKKIQTFRSQNLHKFLLENKARKINQNLRIDKIKMFHVKQKKPKKLFSFFGRLMVNNQPL